MTPPPVIDSLGFEPVGRGERFGASATLDEPPRMERRVIGVVVGGRINYRVAPVVPGRWKRNPSPVCRRVRARE